MAATRTGGPPTVGDPPGSESDGAECHPRLGPRADTRPDPTGTGRPNLGTQQPWRARPRDADPPPRGTVPSTVRASWLVALGAPSQSHHMASAYPADDPAANKSCSRSRPLRRGLPPDSNVNPVAPSLRSRVIADTRTSPAPARAMMRAAACTAKPQMWSPLMTTSPLWM